MVGDKKIQCKGALKLLGVSLSLQVSATQREREREQRDAASSFNLQN